MVDSEEVIIERRELIIDAHLTRNDTVNGLKLFPRTIACRANGPFMSLYEQQLWLSECGRQA